MLPWPEIQLYHSWGGYMSQNQNVTLTWDFNFSIPGGVHQPEPKCHIDLRFQLSHSWGGGAGTPARTKMSHWLEISTFPFLGQKVHWKSLLLASSFQSWNEKLVFGLRSTSDDWPGWSMDSNPICHPYSAKKMKCSFLDYVQLLMIGRACRWTWTPYATPLQPKKWNARFWIMLIFWWLAV